jgi:hypothetical protein
MIDPSVITFLALFTKNPRNLALIPALSENNDASRTCCPVNFLDQQITVAHPSDFQDDAICERHRSGPCQSPNDWFGCCFRGKSVGVDGNEWVGSPWFRIPAALVSKETRTSASTHFITKFSGYGWGSIASPEGL